MIRKYLSKVKELIVPEGSEIQVSAFNILAVCGIFVSFITAFYNLFTGYGFISFLECISGVFIALSLIVYARKSGNYMTAMILTVLIVFVGLFTLLYLTNGAYYGGVPYFFIFATVFTAFLLEGVLAPIFVLIELILYAGLCLYTYYHPSSVYLNRGEEIRVIDLIVCQTIVSISLSTTIYLQIRAHRKKQQDLNALILSAEEANKAKSDFLAKMSHDIRTPLNTIMAMNEMIVSNTSSAKIREWVNDSNVSGRILISLIDDMLDLTRIEAGRISILEQPWDVRDLFAETVKIWKPQADKAGLELKSEIDDNLPDFLMGDEYIIRKITNNLLSNAVKYTKSGRITLNVSWEQGLEIAVSDTGVGIAPQYLDKIFKPFERGVQDIYKETSGSGLGLAIVKELVDAMGGTINCKSVLDEGTLFTVFIPLEKASDMEGARSKAGGKGSQNEGIREQFVAPDAHVLVVDDNEFNRKVIKEFLEATLIQTDDVESGYEALEMIDIKDYDLILMDLRMPKMDGAETLERIRKEYPGFNTPVVVITADIMEGVEERLLKQGFAAFLAKPISSSKLYETIASFIPDKIVSIETEDDNALTLAKIEGYQKMFIPYGIDLNLAIEYNAGSTDEFLMRAELFDKYADENISSLKEAEYDENYYLQVHAIKSIAKGVGAFLLAKLAETDELRNDEEYSREISPVIINEYERVRTGLQKFMEERS